MFEDLIPQSAGDNPFADLQPGAMVRGEKPVDGGFFAAAKQSGGSLLKGAGQFAADFIPGVTSDNAVKRYGQEVIDANPTAVQSLSDIADKPLTAIKEATGNAAGSMAGIVGSRLVGQGITAAAPLAGPAAPVVAAVGQGISLLGPYAVAAVPSFGSIREKQQSDTPQDKAIAALGAGTVGLIENKFGPQEWALSAMTKAGRDQLAEKFAAKTLTGSIAKGIGTGAAVEGGEELVQNPIEQLASHQDPRTPENLADTAFSGAMGAIGGGVVGGPMAGLSHRQPQPVTVPRQDGQGEALIDPATGPLSAAAADHVTRTQTDQDLFADMMPAAPVDSAIEPQQVSGSMFDDLIPADEPISPLLSWQQETDPVSLEEAQAVVQQARDAGYDGHAVIRHGNGFTAVPKEWLNTDQVKAAELLQPAPAKDLFADLPTTIDQPASQANTAPTEAQIAAGNYQKGHIKVGSLDIAIENPVGSTRTGPGWATTMQDHYGYMKRTEGADGDQVDVYVKQGTPTDHSGPVFVVDQYDPATGKFDEHKAMVGYVFKGAALKAYDAHFSDGSGPSRRKGVTKMTAEQFKDWAQNGDTQAPAATLKVAPEVAKSGKPRLAETADDLWRTIKAKTDSGVVFGGQILYPVVDTLGSGEFRISSKGIDKIGREGTVTPATKGEIAELHDAIEKDQAQVHLLTRWGGSGRERGQRVAQIIHSPSGNSFGAATKAPATIQDFGEKIGGARKDLAQPTGPKVKAAPTPAETEPVWQRRFQPLQNMLRSDETWNLIDTKTGKPVRGAEFKTEQAAKDAIPLIAVAQKHRVVSVKDGFEIMRDVTDRKRVKVVDQVFPTRDAAMTYMAQHAQAIIETKTSFREELFARPEKVMRDGQPRRTGHATAEDFAKTFGFRGVEFGLWNNQDERQEVMNHAYDGLLDLAEVLGVPPKALSLNGDLALAFGARGQGLSGAIAHYERGHAVINLTKMQGAGALAHEWFHAADHYFGRQDGKASSEKIQNKRGDTVFDTDGTGDYASHGLSLKSKMREELQAKYKALIQTLFTKAEQYVEDTEKAERFVGSTRDSLVKSLTGMRKQLEKAPEWQKRNNKPATAEQLAEFDRLADDLVEGRAFQLETRSSEPKKGRRFGNIRLSNDQLDALSALFKAVRGRNGMNGEGTGIVDGIRSDLRRYAERVRMLEEARSGNEKTKRVPTEFAMNAKRIDQGSATDYWTTPHEMAARAFSAYVEDKLPGRSDFLSYGSDNAMPQYRLFGVRPFPEGAERVAIGKAFDDFVGALQTRETEKGIELYNQPAAAKPSSGFDQYLFSVASQGDAKTILNAIAQVSDNTFNRELAKLLMAQNLATTIQTAAFDGQHSGGYNPQTDVITIMQATDAEQTILHELMHASTVRALSNKSVAAGAMRSLLKEVRQHLGLDSHYGLTDVREFVADAFSNHEFQEALRQIPVKASGIRGKIADAWGRFVSTVRQLLGLDRDQETALGKALELGARLMQENQTAPLRGYMGEIIGNQAKTDDDRLTVRDWLTHQLANQRSWALGALTRDQLADIYGREMPEVAEFDRVVQQMDQARNIVAEQADALIERWRKLPSKMADALADVMHLATLEQFDPDTKTREEVQTPEQSILVKEWGNLSPEAQQIYRDVRDQYQATLVKLRNGLAKRADTQTAAAIRLEFDKYLAEGPYFPLARFGDFILIANNRIGERIVEAFESSAAREKRARGLRAQGWTTKLTAKKAYSAASDGPSGEFVGKVLGLVGGLDIEAKEKAALMDSLNQLAIGALPDQSYRRHFTHRKGTPGFSQDAMRSFASSMQHVAHHVARVLHGDELQILVDGLNKRTRETTGDVDTTAMQQVANELSKRLDLMLNPTTHPVTAALGQVGFVMSLGGSVASGITNLSQTPLVTFPWLGSRFGFTKAAAALTAASKDYFAGRWDRWSGFVMKDSTNLSADERRALTELEDAGLINLTQAHDLAGTANTDSASSRRSFAINRAMKLVGWTFHVPEVMNRQVSALAAYRLAREKGLDYAAAVETARETLRRTHFDYSASNRARWMAGNFTRVITMFKQYSQNVTYLLWRQTYQALKGETPEVRQEARRMLLGVAATHFAAAGALGLPLGVFGVTPLLGLLAMGLGSEDEPWDWQVEFRNLLADLFGKQAGEAIAHGPLRTLTGIDMAARVGLGDLWVRAPQAEKEGRDLVEAWMLTLLGPVAGYAGNIGTAMKAFDEGKVGRGLEAMLPKFIAAPIKAARYENEGVKSWRGDDLGVKLDGGDIFATALGFQPSQLAEMFEGQRAIKGREAKLMARREEIGNMFTASTLAGDAAMQAEAIKAAQAFSLRNPSMALTADSLRRSLQAKVRNQALIQDGVYLSKKRQDLRAEGRFTNVE